MSAVTFRDLSRTESLRILRRNQVGRIAYALHDQVDVQPIHYVTDGSWLYIRTSPGTKTAVLARNRWLSLQTDEIESPFSWRSVIVRGTAYVLSPDATPDLATRYARAIGRIRRVIPDAFTERDPVPFRSVVLGIHLEEVTGRAASERRTGRGAAGGRTRRPGTASGRKRRGD